MHGEWIGSCPLLVVLLLVVWAGDSRAEQPAENPLFHRLVTEGVDVGGREPFKLPPPLLDEQAGAAGQRTALESLADANHTLAALERRSIVAPFVLRMTDEMATDAARPRRVDVWYFAYGDLARLGDDVFLSKQLDASQGAARKPDGPNLERLSDEQLRARKMEIDDRERFYRFQLALFDRVEIQGVMRARLTRGARTVTLAAEIDPRFDADAALANQWRSLTRDESGKLKVGVPQTYHRAGWYLRATQLAEPAGALLVEYHLVFDEPQGWFGGANLLRSKLPILVQDSVRGFRRTLEQSAKER